MNLTLLAAVALIVWAAVITINASFASLSPTQFVASVVLAIAVAIQRISGVQRWLTSSKNRRKDQVDLFAQQVLVNLCMGRTISPEMLHLCVHVWEVPLWYRKIFPYALRWRLKCAVRMRGLRLFASWVIRPALHRVIAVGLVKRAPSGVRFFKGIGLVGVCIANNDFAEFVTLKTSSSQYSNALKARSEAEWHRYGPAITHNLLLEDAVKLSHSYGQVLAKVVQDPDSGEAIGCVTISARYAGSTSLQITKNDNCQKMLTDLALSVGRLLV